MKCNKSATSGAGIEVSVSCDETTTAGRGGETGGRVSGGSQPHLQLIATNFAVQITNCISGLAAQRRVRSVCNDKAYRGNDITAAPAPPLPLSPFFYTPPDYILWSSVRKCFSFPFVFVLCFCFFCKFYGAQIKFALRLLCVEWVAISPVCPASFACLAIKNRQANLCRAATHTCAYDCVRVGPL